MGLVEKNKNLSNTSAQVVTSLLPKFSTQREYFPFRTSRSLECAKQKLQFIVQYEYSAKK